MGQMEFRLLQIGNIWQKSSLMIVMIRKPMALQQADHMTRVKEKTNAGTSLGKSLLRRLRWVWGQILKP